MNEDRIDLDEVKQEIERAAESDVSLHGQIQAKEDEIKSLVDRIMRLQAEFENYKKRMARDVEVMRVRAEDGAILDFLPLFDNLERAFGTYAKDHDKDALASGVEQIFGQFAQILEQKGIKRLRTVGETFDPALHEALVSVASEETKNIILEEFSPGYVRNGRTLRPSKVAVSQGPEPEEKEES